jgi:putative NADPH-quinone reductase
MITARTGSRSAERRSYNTQSPDLAAVALYVARLQAAEALVLCFPTWWYGAVRTGSKLSP